MSSVAVGMEIKAYIAAIERYLDDLPEDDRRELLEDLEQHLAEVAADADGKLEDRLGAPEAYAAELRASAGIPEREASHGSIVGTVLRRARDVRRYSLVAAVLDFMPQLRPAWWVLRGYLAIMAIDAWLFTANGVTSNLVIPIPYFNQKQGFGLIAIALAIWASVALGMRSGRCRRVRYTDIAATLAVVVLTLTTSPFQPTYDYMDAEYAETVMPEWLHHKDGSPISNICAYDSKLQALDRVLLYDQMGRPIDNHAPPEWGDETVPGAELQPGFGNIYPRPQRIVDPSDGSTKDFTCPTLERSAERQEKAKAKPRR